MYAQRFKFFGRCFLFSGYANTALGIVFPQNDGMDLALCHSCDQVFDCTVLSMTSLDCFVLFAGFVVFDFICAEVLLHMGCV